jgi:hypothetical protein
VRPAAAVTAKAPGSADLIDLDWFPTLRAEPLRAVLYEQGKVLLFFNLIHASSPVRKMPEPLKSMGFPASKKQWRILLHHCLLKIFGFF